MASCRTGHDVRLLVRHVVPSPFARSSVEASAVSPRHQWVGGRQACAGTAGALTMSRSPERKDRFPLKEVDGRADPTAAAATPGSYARCSGPLARPPLTAMQNAESGHRPVGRAERRCEYRPAAPHDLASTRPAATFRQPSLRPPTTVRTPPSPRPARQQPESPDSPGRFTTASSRDQGTARCQASAEMVSAISRDTVKHQPIQFRQRSAENAQAAESGAGGARTHDRRIMSPDGQQP